MNYSIADFWVERLSGISARSECLVKGWHSGVNRLTTFTEAPLLLSENFGEGVDPKLRSLIFISAPGAVGKSTLARQLA
jgi:pantothenate kinase